MHALTKNALMLLALSLLIVGAVYGGLLRMISETWSGSHPALRLRSFLLGAWESLYVVAAVLLALFGFYALTLWSVI